SPRLPARQLAAHACARGRGDRALTRTFAEENLRWNLLTLGADFGFFMIGLAFMSSATVLPAFAASLGASTVLIGAIPAVMTVGWFLPPLFAAAHTERLPRKLPFVLKWTGWERVPFLDRKSTRLNSSHLVISYAVFCLKKKKVSHLTEQIFLSVNDRRVPER